MNPIINLLNCFKVKIVKKNIYLNLGKKNGLPQKRHQIAACCVVVDGFSLLHLRHFGNNRFLFSGDFSLKMFLYPLNIFSGYFYLTYFPILVKLSTTKIINTPKKEYKITSSATLPVFSSCCSSNKLIM